MARPITATEPQSMRSTPVTWHSVTEKKLMQAYAQRRGNSLAGLLRMLLAADVAASSTPPRP